MALRLGRDKLPDLYSYLTTLLPSAYNVYVLVQNAMEGKSRQEFWVDQWPDPQALVVSPVTEVEFLCNRYSVFAVNQSAFKDILNAGGIVDWKTSIMFTGWIFTAVLSGAASRRQLAEDTQQAPSPSHVILIPGQPVAALTAIAERQAKQQQLLLLPFLVRLDPAQKRLLYRLSHPVWKGVSLSQDVFPALKEVAEEHGFRLATYDPDWSDMYYVDKDGLRLVDLPKEMTLSKLSLKHAQLVNGTWKFNRGEKSTSYFEFLIKNHPSVGLFDVDGDLLAFELMTYYGAMGALYVMPEHRRKGYGSYVTSALAQMTMAAGRMAYVYLERSNKRSIHLHQKMGFKKVPCSPVAWINAIKGTDGEIEMTSVKPLY